MRYNLNRPQLTDHPTSKGKYLAEQSAWISLTSHDGSGVVGPVSIKATIEGESSNLTTYEAALLDKLKEMARTFATQLQDAAEAIS